MKFSLFLLKLFLAFLFASFTFAQYHLDSIGGKKYSVSSRQSKMVELAEENVKNATKENTNIIKIKQLENQSQNNF